MSIKKRYNIFIYMTLTLAVICIVAGILGNDQKTSNAITEETKTTKKETDPLAKTNKRLLIISYIGEIAGGLREDPYMTAEMIDSWFKYEVGTIEYQSTRKDTANDTNIFSYKVELKIANQGATLPADNGETIGTEFITTNLIFNFEFDEYDSSYVVESVELP